MRYLSLLLFLIIAIAQLSAQEFKSITVAGYSTTIKEKRLALVIGNNNYKYLSKLHSPGFDAKYMKMALQACGFEVIYLEDGTKESIESNIDIFSEKLKSYDVGLIYYSGHGAEINGVTYLVPVDMISTSSLADIEYKCVETKWSMKKMAEAGNENKTYIMILDACRDNPFLDITKSTKVDCWTKPQSTPSGSIICFAASNGEQANQGDSLSPYTQLMLKHMKTPGLNLEGVFKKVRIDLTEMRKSNPRLNMVPVEENKLTTEFYFVPAKEEEIPRIDPDLKPVTVNTKLATLKIFSTVDGTIKIDTEQKGTIKANEILLIEKLSIGEHFVQLITTNGDIKTETVKISSSDPVTIKFEIITVNDKDKDKDNIQDAEDSCPDNFGPPCTKGCPDRDGDCIADKDDNCPDEKGTLKGCPDSDGDGVANKEDNCPDEKGTLKGCPDSDGDGVANKDDNCPNEKGTLKGCPDADGDGVANNDDECLNLSGPKKSNGCPDADGDGFADKDDNCPNVKGSIKGCPDADGDGIADMNDYCPYLRGKSSNNGCPTQAMLRYTGDNLGCVLNLTFWIGDQKFVPNSGIYYIDIEEGTYNYTISGEISCATGKYCPIISSGTIIIKHRSILDFSFNNNCGSVLTNTGKYQ
jgi:hypothetical protein